MSTTRLSTQVSEGATPSYRVLLLDDNNVPIISAAINALTLTICESGGTRDVVNGVVALNILNTNRGSFYDPPQLDANGNQYNVLVLLRTGDTVMLDPALDQEFRSLIIEWTYNASVSVGKHEVQFPISPIRPG